MRTAADVGNAVTEGPLKDVLVVYDDFATGLRARRAPHQTTQQFAMEADLDVNLWNFGLLREPSLYEQAANEAAEADIVFVSAHSNDELLKKPDHYERAPKRNGVFEAHHSSWRQ